MRRENGYAAVGVVAVHARPLGAQQPAHLGSYCVENLGVGYAARDQGRHPPQRRLLLRDLRERLAALGVRDSRRNELRKLRQAPLRVVGQRPVGRGDHGQYTPEASLDRDRHPHRRAPAHRAAGGGGCSGLLCVVVDP